MRRNKLLTLLGCIAVIIAVALLIRQAAVLLSGEVREGRAGSSAGKLASAGSDPRMSAVPAPEKGEAAEHKGEQHKKSAAQLLHDTLAALPTFPRLDFRPREAAIAELIRNLRAAGPEGLEALRRFFRTDQDMTVGNGFGMKNGRTSLYTFRIAMLDALADWPGPEALALAEEVFRSTPRALEAEIALIQIETKNPGAYRDEAIERLKQTSNASAEIRGRLWQEPFLALMSYYQAPELIQIAEDMRPGWRAASLYLSALTSCPTEMSAPAMERLFSRPEIAAQLAKEPWMFHDMPYAEPSVLQNVARIFDSAMDSNGKEKFLGAFEVHDSMYGMTIDYYLGELGAGNKRQSDAGKKTELQARLAFLEQISPQCTTPVLQEKLQAARGRIEKLTANLPTDGK